MHDANAVSSTRNSLVIKAPREALYRAFTDPAALAAWLAPGDMTGQIHEFDGRVGGGYQMSLYYPASEAEQRGKTAEREDRYSRKNKESIFAEVMIQAVWMLNSQWN